MNYLHSSEMPTQIANGHKETRQLVRGEWGGDTYFYFDENGLAYEQIANGPDTFEQVSSGDYWSREAA